MTAKGSLQSHCKRGHPLVEVNVYRTGNGNRCCRQCTLERAAKRYESLSTGEKEAVFLRQRIRHTGRTKENYEAVYREQKGCCAICGKSDLSRWLASDHDHRCCENGCEKCVRGFLCQTCNQGIGFLLDSPDLLRKAAEYIEFWRQKHESRSSGDVV